MPYYSSGDGDSGTVPALDRNLPTPHVATADAGDPMAKPDFIVQLQQRLADIRNELSDLLSSRYGGMLGAPAMGGGPPKVTANSLAKQAENDLKKDQLENEEAAICAQLNNYLYVGTLGDYDASTEEEGDDGGDAGDVGD